MKRVVDITLSSLGLLFLLPLMCLIAAAILINSKGPALYWSLRVGCNNTKFKMPKFRTMSIRTPELATHLLDNPDKWITSIGHFLRRTSLDELPQLWSILRGDMSIVGPRPALFNQYDLIALRTSKGLHRLTPGLTGWAQVNGRDDLSVAQKVDLDLQYMRLRTIRLDFRIMFMTLIRFLKRSGVSH